MRLHSRLRDAVGVCLSLGLLAGCGGSSPGGTPAASAPTQTALPRTTFTVGLVTDAGRLHDRSFNDAVYAGMRQQASTAGVRTLVMQPGSAQAYGPLLTRMSQKRPNLIVAVGGSMSAAVYQAATTYPMQDYVLVDGIPLDPHGHGAILANVANLLFKEQDAGFLVGELAGLMERHRVGRARHNTIGYLGGTNIPQVTRYIAGYIAGARHADPTVRIIGQYAGTFTDPTLGKSIARQQVAAGADVLFQVAAVTGTGYLTQGGALGAYGIGADTDQRYLGAYMISSAVKRVDIAIQDTIQRTRAGHFPGGDNLYGADSGWVDAAGPSPIVPVALAQQLRTTRQSLATGAIQAPTSVPAR